MKPAAPHPLRCPLCGQPNQCALASGQPARSCWCMARRLAPCALAALPEGLRGQVCICAACGAWADRPAPAPI
ncbi:cysteine-rich CWC family protein [Verminephrobacter eiseniae]|uniref:cysteine-rich CWC family protein n=1 Tax=Verminephrobacter eiseniae TaxID=364317 RepID=UPI0010D3D6E8|nr:cysteine-rich CWC family protein [Verminephrobacter eiseniae]KAB7579038.1 cysteine-rich CWC family protein [Verminephrobacter sp. Larva24]MCW5234393.1 hypothetical protein [Verminephrobacter eiseniae]MCW5294031.1 hypothetical protein [Verminephrobacter eiseniae]MCW8183231.1 hypothetical protein [Verminephrobacter eiseniae]MCW8222172.1 hypothetical protein [Verminephrobacter eiseniae]